jgi:hypothetical protein
MRSGFRRWLIPATALASMVLVSGGARAQFNGPETRTSTQTINNNATVNSTAGSFVVHTTGNGQAGFNILGGASFTVLPSTFGTRIITEGSNAPGIAVSSAIHTLTLADLTIMTSGASSDGILLAQQGDNIDATRVTLTATGAGASALAMTAGGGGQSSTENFTDSVLASTQGPVIRVSGGGSNKFINLIGSTVDARNPDGLWLSVTGGSSVVTITASDATTLTGAAMTAAGSTSNVTLNNSLWTMTGNSGLTRLTNNAGSNIVFTAPANPGNINTYKTLTTTNYIGGGGGITLTLFSAPTIRPPINS